MTMIMMTMIITMMMAMAITMIMITQIQNSLFSTQHIVNTTMFSCMRRVEKGASRRQCLCRLVPYLNNIKIYNTQLLIGDNDLNNHNNNVRYRAYLMFLQCY